MPQFRTRRVRRRWGRRRPCALAKQAALFVATFVLSYGFLSNMKSTLFKPDDTARWSVEGGGGIVLGGSDDRGALTKAGGYYGPPCIEGAIAWSRGSLAGRRRKTVVCDEPRSDDAATAGRAGPPRKMSDTTNPVYFLHVGKAGGTSVDALMKGLLKCNSAKLYVGERHYDWSYVERHQGLRRRFREIEQHADVITFLRHPVSRAVSQFHFSKTLPWARRDNATFLHQTFDEYLDDPDKTWTQPIADGESGTDFLAGIFPSGTNEGWVGTDGRETESKAHLRANGTAACLLAAERLERTVWFGLMEDVERSMALLQATLGLDAAPVLPRINSNGNNGMDRGRPRITDRTREKIKRYVPKDLWLYEYATRLFEARWRYFMGEDCAYVPPELPPLPDFE